MSSQDDTLDTALNENHYVQLTCHKCRQIMRVMFDGPPPKEEPAVESSPTSLREFLRSEITDDDIKDQSPPSSPSPIAQSSPQTLSNIILLQKSLVRNVSFRRQQHQQLRQQQLKKDEEYELWRDKNKFFLGELCRYALDHEGEHLLCPECSEQSYTELTREHESMMEELKQYQEFNITKEGVSKLGDMMMDVKKLEQEEEKLRQQLQEVLAEEKMLDSKVQSWEESQLEWKVKEDRYWHEFSQFQMQHQLFEQERDAQHQKIAHTTRELDRLNSTNVFNDAFHIWYEGHFGTINNIRLGRLPTQPVEWNEINAAWGLAALLLHTLAKSKNLTFSKYKIILNGSFSKIELTDGSASTYELYGGGGGGGGLFWAGRFDKAMVFFLQCIKELSEHIAKSDPTFTLPYRIEADRIGSLTIKCVNDELWTKSLKFEIFDKCVN
ncbi:vacuolar protein sorting protein VPS30 [Acrasis kona]|uniref:Vacuolar protein sorting protein VPS30 n=1 Tax=Acrasis kona TaxID=1008807 RepID=A0AAW2YGK3_9EUKA